MDTCPHCVEGYLKCSTRSDIFECRCTDEARIRMGLRPLIEPSKWVPISNKVDLAHLGKLGEEASALSGIAHRCIIQGLRNGEANPDTGKLNIEALEDEIANVMAQCQMNVARFDLNKERIAIRAARKVRMKQAWHVMLEDK